MMEKWVVREVGRENTVSKTLEEGHVQNHENPPEGMNEEIDDSGRGERGM